MYKLKFGAMAATPRNTRKDVEIPEMSTAIK
jgi:hypothetical protein